MNKLLFVGAAALLLTATVSDGAFARGGGGGRGGGGMRGGGFGGFHGAAVGGGFRGGGFRAAGIGGFRGAGIGPGFRGGWRPGWRGGWGWPVGAALGVGALGYYGSSYYSDPCLAWNGYNWVNFCY
jgi:hypothetical protein